MLSALDTCISPIKRSSPPTRTRRSLIGSSCACAWALRERCAYDLHDENERLAYCKLYCELRIFVLLAFEYRQSRREGNILRREFRLDWGMTIAMLKFLRTIFLNYLLSFSLFSTIVTSVNNNTNIRKLRWIFWNIRIFSKSSLKRNQASGVSYNKQLNCEYLNWLKTLPLLPFSSAL